MYESTLQGDCGLPNWCNYKKKCAFNVGPFKMGVSHKEKEY